MKSTGIIRRIDDLGRVVIPKEIRRAMRIREGDPLEIYTEGNGTVCFRKYSPIDEIDLDTVKKICDSGLGSLNYILFNRDGEPVLPKAEARINIDDLPPLVVAVKYNGELFGYLQSPSGNKEIVADIIGGLLRD